MRRWVVDTNVPIVANGRPDPNDARPPSLDCREKAVTFLQEVIRTGKVLTDLAGEIQAEYRRYLNPSGQPGVGDRFYEAVLRSAPRFIERIELPKRSDGEFADCPQALIDAGFDPDDRKFAALASRAGVPVANATDSDWSEARDLLRDNGIRVEFVCGCDPAAWFRA